MLGEHLSGAVSLFGDAAACAAMWRAETDARFATVCCAVRATGQALYCQRPAGIRSAVARVRLRYEAML